MTPDAMAAALLERHAAIRALLGDTYNDAVRPYGRLLVHVMLRDRIAVLPALLRLVEPIADHEWAVALFMCAAVDLMDREAH